MRPSAYTALPLQSAIYAPVRCYRYALKRSIRYTSLLLIEKAIRWRALLMLAVATPQEKAMLRCYALLIRCYALMLLPSWLIRHAIIEMRH